MKRLLVIPVIVTALLIISGCSTPASSKVSEETKKTKVVNITKVKEQEQSSIMTKAGVVEAKQENQLAFGTSGKIVTLSVKKGMKVKAGQVLGTLDTSGNQSTIALSQTQINEAQAKRAKILRGDSKVADTYDSTIQQTEDSIADTEDSIKKQEIKIQDQMKTLEQDKTDLQRKEVLFSNGAISKADIDGVRTKVDRAQLSLKSEQTELEALKQQKKRLQEQKQLTLRQREKAIQADKDNADRLASITTEVATAQNGIVKANKEIQDSRLIAPFDGIITDVSSHPGDVVSQGSSVATIVDLSGVKVSIEVESALIQQFTKGKSMTVINEGGEKTAGSVTYISPLIDAKNGKYKVEITVPHSPEKWQGGMIASVQMPRKLATSTILPLECIGVGEKGRYVLVVENGMIKKRTVEIGQIIDDKIEVLSGVHPGDSVVTSGISFLLEGEKVTPKEG
ncbi:efflux RND transporter periplasmic adaptor subunit [Aneurinibacillus migulanus]|uniref:efflux RND transporter periplasmic adaptor subunit n=2 Tax=Aneurinibacillus migulanus TaxID=47500 RepID=UPI000B155092|nr:efflux RND transporter periplasmic adaptor subunit [Aneurinibacillus migulanus]